MRIVSAQGDACGECGRIDGQLFARDRKLTTDQRDRRAVKVLGKGDHFAIDGSSDCCAKRSGAAVLGVGHNTRLKVVTKTQGGDDSKGAEGGFHKFRNTV